MIKEFFWPKHIKRCEAMRIAFENLDLEKTFPATRIRIETDHERLQQALKMNFSDFEPWERRIYETDNSRLVNKLRSRLKDSDTLTLIATPKHRSFTAQWDADLLATLLPLGEFSTPPIGKPPKTFGGNLLLTANPLQKDPYKRFGLPLPDFAYMERQRNSPDPELTPILLRFIFERRIKEPTHIELPR